MTRFCFVLPMGLFDYFSVCEGCVSVSDFQESPTGELVDYTFSVETEANEQESSEEKISDQQLQPDPELEAELEAQSCETFCVSEGTDGSNSVEGEL